MISFLILFIGAISEHRILSRFAKEKMINNTLKTQIFIFYSFFSAIIWLFFIKKQIFVWFFTFTANFLSYFLPNLIQKHRKNEFQSRSIQILDHLILSLRSGKSFRDSLMEMKLQLKNEAFYFQEIIHAVLLQESPQQISSDFEVQRFYFELLQALKSHHRIIEKLSVFRHTLKTESWFQQKIKQAMLPSRAQSLIMTAIYAGLMLYVFLSGGFRDNSDLIVSSLFIYLIGAFWIWKMGRSFRWKG